MWDALMSFLLVGLILLFALLCIAYSPKPFILEILSLGILHSFRSLIAYPVHDLHMPSCNYVFMACMFCFVSTCFHSCYSLW